MDRKSHDRSKEKRSKLATPTIRANSPSSFPRTEASAVRRLNSAGLERIEGDVESSHSSNVGPARVAFGPGSRAPVS
jgi:hypothetical protein